MANITKDMDIHEILIFNRFAFNKDYADQYQKYFNAELELTIDIDADLTHQVYSIYDHNLGYEIYHHNNFDAFIYLLQKYIDLAIPAAESILEWWGKNSIEGFDLIERPSGYMLSSGHHTVGIYNRMMPAKIKKLIIDTIKICKD